MKGEITIYFSTHLSKPCIMVVPTVLFSPTLSKERFDKLCKNIQHDFEVWQKCVHPNIFKVEKIWWKEEDNKKIPHLVFTGSRVYWQEFLEIHEKLEDIIIVKVFAQLLVAVRYVESIGVEPTLQRELIGVIEESNGNIRINLLAGNKKPEVSVESLWQELIDRSEENSPLRIWKLPNEENTLDTINSLVAAVKNEKESFTDCETWLHVYLAEEYFKKVEKNFTKVAEYNRLAAKKGDSVAQFRLARCYYKGEGVKKNFEKAVK